ncbi:hypothetical protein SALBM311S_03684 [Streptomyces alboniger]
MLPAQVLVLNLCFDAALRAFAHDRPGAAALRRPAVLRPRAFLRFISGFGVLNAVADLATFAVLALALRGPDALDDRTVFHSAWFTENLLTQALVMRLLRTGRGLADGRCRGPVGRAAALLAVAGLLAAAELAGRVACHDRSARGLLPAARRAPTACSPSRCPRPGRGTRDVSRRSGSSRGRRPADRASVRDLRGHGRRGRRGAHVGGAGVRLAEYDTDPGAGDGLDPAPGKALATVSARVRSPGPYSTRVTGWFWTDAVAVPVTVKPSAVSAAAARAARPVTVVPL